MANYVQKKLPKAKQTQFFMRKLISLQMQLGPDIALRLKFIYSESPFQQSSVYFLSIVQCMHIYTYIPELLELLVCPP